MNYGVALSEQGLLLVKEETESSDNECVEKEDPE